MKFAVTFLDETGSTNDDVMELARNNAPEGIVICANRQTKGRGRQQRIWQSPIGNLYASALLRPSQPQSTYGQLSLVIGLAMGEAVGSYGAEWQLKWPNDILCNGEKIAGILLESEQGWVVAGTGVNVELTPAVSDKACTSLHTLGYTQATAAEVLQRYLQRLAVWYGCWQDEGFSPIREAWLAKAWNIGGAMTARLASGISEEGRFAGIDHDGALLLQQGDTQRRILSGDVFFA